MEVIIGIKPAPGEHESNFQKVGSIPWKPLLGYLNLYCKWYKRTLNDITQSNAIWLFQKLKLKDEFSSLRKG